MELILNENPLWTRGHIEFFRKYEKSYGMCMPDTLYKQELSNIINGNPTRRCSSDRKCYEIFVDESYVGDIIIDEYNEIDILIFDKYAGKGYAQRAIKLFLDDYYNGEARVEAVVRGENEEKDKIKRVLNKLGFRHEGTSIEGNEIWIIQ